MCKVLIFGGTTEGRQLWEYCRQEEIPAEMYVATEYGANVLEESDAWMEHIHVGRMDCLDMTRLFEREGCILVVDATHPYAAEVSDNLLKACNSTGKSRIRVSRGSCMEASELLDDADMILTESVTQAAEYLKERTGNILVTTGSKELEKYTVIPGYRDRIYVRVLPNPDVLARCISLGIEGSHLIGMQGPFSVEMNCAMINEYGIRWLVMKDSGVQGGFREKFHAAKQTGIRCVVITRKHSLSADTESASLQDTKRKIKEWYRK
ncbi:MAG: precorrin-6A reductase [Lachnospiraceae bacterium]